jgi:hypothetical protein
MNLQDKLKELKYKYVYHGLDHDEFFSLIDALEIAVSRADKFKNLLEALNEKIQNGAIIGKHCANHIWIEVFLMQDVDAIEQIKTKLGCV